MILLQYIVSGLIAGSLYALIALGFVLIYKATEVVNFAQGEVAMFGAYMGVLFIILAKLPLTLSIACILLSTGLFGIIVERLIYQPLIKAPVLTVIICTIGMGVILKAGIRLVFGPNIYALPPLFSTKPVILGGIYVTKQNLAILAVSILMMIILFLFFKFTKIGKGMRAAQQNKSTAALMGINVKRVFSLTWGMGFLFGGIGGFLLGPLVIVTPDMGSVGIKAFVATVIGGFTSLPGAIIGGFSLGIIENLAGGYISTAFKDVVSFLVLILVLIFRPTGLFAEYTKTRV